MNDITLPPDECAIVSQEGMTRLELHAPNLAEGQEMPPLMRFLLACFLRSHNDPEFVAEQIRWFDEHGLTPE